MLAVIRRCLGPVYQLQDFQRLSEMSACLPS